MQGDTFKIGCVLFNTPVSPAPWDIYYLLALGQEPCTVLSCWQRSFCRATSSFHFIWKLWAVTKWQEMKEEYNVQLAVQRHMWKITFVHGCSSAYWKHACMMWTLSSLCYLFHLETTPPPKSCYCLPEQNIYLPLANVHGVPQVAHGSVHMAYSSATVLK